MLAPDPQLGWDVQRRRVGAMLGSIGSALEWYDFTLYVYMAPVLASLFFPSSDPTVCSRRTGCSRPAF
jgi:hypothetical protein